MTTLTVPATPSLGRQMLNKVPEVTLWFWIIKILCTTVGETFSDYLSDTVGWGLTNTSYVMGAALLVVLAIQFSLKRYVPLVYWLAVVLISVVGTNITDNLTDNFGVSLAETTTIFAILLIAWFILWHTVEGTLSIHSIVTTGREAFYWVVILLTFALGTSVGDQVSEQFDLGYLTALWIFAAIIGAIVILHYAFHLNAILSFWLAYIMTRPLGASIGDWLSQAKDDGGLGLGTTNTSLIFLALILALVVYLTISKADRTPPDVT
jgi:hypothetical protein